MYFTHCILNISHCKSPFVALDPANPIFYLSGCYLKCNDAAWLDIIHTDIGRYGGTFKGTADYYINGGIHPQPGCDKLGVPLSPEGNNN